MARRRRKYRGRKVQRLRHKRSAAARSRYHGSALWRYNQRRRKRRHRR